MPVAGLPKALETLLVTCVEEFDVNGWQISSNKNGCMVKINFRTGSHMDTVKPHVQSATYKKKTPSQENRDQKRLDSYKTQKSGYGITTRAKSKDTEVTRKACEDDHKLLDISPVSIESAAPMESNCSPVISENQSDETTRSFNSTYDNVTPLKGMLTFHSDDVPLTFGDDSPSDLEHCDSGSVCDYAGMQVGGDSEIMVLPDEQPTVEASDTDCDQLVTETNNDDDELDYYGNCECTPEDKPYSTCMQIFCDLAKMNPHPDQQPMFRNGYHKCSRCGIQLCGECYFLGKHYSYKEYMVYHPKPKFNF